MVSIWVAIGLAVVCSVCFGLMGFRIGQTHELGVHNRSCGSLMDWEKTYTWVDLPPIMQSWESVMVAHPTPLEKREFAEYFERVARQEMAQKIGAHWDEIT